MGVCLLEVCETDVERGWGRLAVTTADIFRKFGQLPMDVGLRVEGLGLLV